MEDAFKAHYSTTKFIMGRKVMQVVLEVPMENAGQVFDILGYPDPHNSKWVGVALLKDEG